MEIIILQFHTTEPTLGRRWHTQPPDDEQNDDDVDDVDKVNAAGTWLAANNPTIMSSVVELSKNASVKSDWARVEE